MTRHDAMLEICRILLEFEIEQQKAESAAGPSDSDSAQPEKQPAGAPQGQPGQAKIKRGKNESIS